MMSCIQSSAIRFPISRVYKMQFRESRKELTRRVILLPGNGENNNLIKLLFILENVVRGNLQCKWWILFQGIGIALYVEYVTYWMQKWMNSSYFIIYYIRSLGLSWRILRCFEEKENYANWRENLYEE